MDLGLEGRVALVTGASQGIGRAVARALVDEGAQVAVSSRSRERIDRAAAEVGAAGAYVHDMADLDAAPALLESVEEDLILSDGKRHDYSGVLFTGGITVSNG